MKKEMNHGAIPESVGFHGKSASWINPNNDENMYKAGFRTVDQMRDEGVFDEDPETEAKLKTKYGG